MIDLETKTEAEPEDFTEELSDETLDREERKFLCNCDTYRG